MKKVMYGIFLALSLVMFSSCRNDDLNDDDIIDEEKPKEEDKYYYVIFDTTGGLPIIDMISVLNNDLVSVPREPSLKGFLFKGWYIDEELYDFNQPVNKNLVITARWDVDEDYEEEEDEVLDFDVFLDSINSYMTEDTEINFLRETNVATATYKSSRPSLLVIEEDRVYINKALQGHQEQKVTVTVDITLNDGSYLTLHKDVTIGPVVYDDIVDTPVATYFYTQAMYHYRRYSEHYIETGEIFTDKMKENLDIVYYSFVTPKLNGTLEIENTGFLAEVRNLKKHGTRVLFTIDGVGEATGKVFTKLTSSKESIDMFVKNIMDLVDRYYLDGVDIDWEPFHGGVIASQLDDFMIALRAEMNKRQAEGGSPYILSTAVPGSRYTLKPQWFNLETLFEVCDYINFMTYELQDRNSTTHHTSLSGGALDLINFLDRNNHPLNKVIIGSGGYGVAFKLNDVGTESPVGKAAQQTLITEYESFGSHASGTVFVYALELMMESDDYELYHDYGPGGVIKGSYLYNINEGIFISFESEYSAKEKVNMIKTFPGMGVMTWAFSQDANDYVLNALIDARNNNDEQ